MKIAQEVGKISKGIGQHQMLAGREQTKGVNRDSVFDGENREQKDEQVIDKELGPKQVIAEQAAARHEIGAAG